MLEEKAGIKSFQKFGYVNTVNSLAGGDVTKWSLILNLPYNIILTKLLLNKAESAYQKKYTELLQAQ